MKKKPSMTVAEMARLGGLAHAEGVREGRIPLSGAAVPKPTVCPRCGKTQPSARAAWRHCRQAKRGRPRKAKA